MSNQTAERLARYLRAEGYEATVEDLEDDCAEVKAWKSDDDNGTVLLEVDGGEAGATANGDYFMDLLDRFWRES